MGAGWAALLWEAAHNFEQAAASIAVGEEVQLKESLHVDLTPCGIVDCPVPCYTAARVQASAPGSLGLRSFGELG